jgi:glucose-6-phosphate 1-dehydrogenase
MEKIMNNNNNKPTYIIFGASGDLARRYLLPALLNMQNMNYVGTVVPISRKDYGNLKNLIPNDGDKIFHLAIPPEAVSDVVKIISDAFGKDNVKIMLEKPFGKDLQSAKNLVNHVDQYFSEHQIFRIDHYLAKQSMQNVVAEKLEKNKIAGIEIIASEKIDIEGRVNFYEQTGALKDFVQSHLLEMAAIVLSQSFKTALRYEALKNLEIVCDVRQHECVKRGQYLGYRAEVNNSKSMTETFVSINMISNDKTWHGVPITLSTGKALSQKLTQIIIKYKDGHKKIFNIEHESDAYERVIRATIEGKHDLFISSDEILETWRILDDLQKDWENSKDDLIIYKKGSTIEEVLK